MTANIPAVPGVLRKGQRRAAREFADADGVLVPVIVYITRTSDRGPVLVSSPRAQPVGRQFRYKQHVSLVEVWRIVHEWIGNLSEDYCLRPECADQRGEEWDRLTRRLADARCLTKEEMS